MRVINSNPAKWYPRTSTIGYPDFSDFLQSDLITDKATKRSCFTLNPVVPITTNRAVVMPSSSSRRPRRLVVVTSSRRRRRWAVSSSASYRQGVREHGDKQGSKCHQREPKRGQMGPIWGQHGAEIGPFGGSKITGD